VLHNLELLMQGFAMIWNLKTLYYIAGGTLGGIILGAIPGLTGAIGMRFWCR
jgi:TctA family transporter